MGISIVRGELVYCSSFGLMCITTHYTKVYSLSIDRRNDRTKLYIKFCPRNSVGQHYLDMLGFFRLVET
jgi:hypothetical protein